MSLIKAPAEICNGVEIVWTNRQSKITKLIPANFPQSQRANDPCSFTFEIDENSIDAAKLEIQEIIHAAMRKIMKPRKYYSFNFEEN